MLLQTLLLAIAAMTSALPPSPAKRTSDVQVSQLRRVSNPRPDRRREDSKHQSGIEHLKSHGARNILTTQITVGSQSFDVGVATGSSDTWIVKKGYICDSGPCLFGPAFTPESRANQVNDVDLNITYVNGEYVQGYFVQDSATLAGVTAPHQQVGAATLAGWNGDGTISGILGLGCVYSRQESSIISTMLSHDLIEPRFALAVSRDEAGSGDAGWLTIGGSPEDLSFPNIDVTSRYASAPLEHYQGGGGYYVITVDSLSYTSTSSSKIDKNAYQFIIDSGSPFNYFPEASAAVINRLFDPPASKDASGSWVVDCSATAPRLSPSIGGQDFPQNPYDMIYKSGTTCFSSIQSASGPGYQILGDPFLRNVLAVFDWGRRQMLLASRPYYQS